MHTRRPNRYHRSADFKEPEVSLMPTTHQGGPVGLEESASLSGTQIPEAPMDTHEVTGTLREAAGKVEKNYGRLKDNAADATREVADQAGMNREQAAGTAREFAGKAERTYGDIKSKVSQAAKEWTDDTREMASRSWDNTVEIVKENPGTAIGVSLLVGAGVGALIAYLASRD
jgi:uncharacterized protein YjbJ (UPF0337 family)